MPSDGDLKKKRMRKEAEPPAPASTAAKVNNHRGVMLFAGTYHSVLAGLVYRQTVEGEHKILLKFSVKNHIGCVNSVCTAGKYIASSGSDERIFLFTNKDHFSQISDLGTLAPASEVRVMKFPDTHFLYCGCEDGSVGVYKTRTWDPVSVLPVHDKAVLDMAVHPSGLIAVTIGADRMIALLDMERGKLITKMKVPKVVPHAVLFSNDASHFAVALPYDVCFYSTLEAKHVVTAKVTPQPPHEIHSMLFLPGDRGCLVGCENATFRFVASKHFTNSNDATTVTETDFSNVEVSWLKAPSDAEMAAGKKKPAVHQSRIKCLQYCNDVLFSSDSDGVVCAWAIVESSNENGFVLQQLCGARCGGRITTLTATPR